MALRVLELRHKADALEEKLSELRSKRIEAYSKRNKLEDEIDAVDANTPEDTLKDVEARVDETVKNISELEQQIVETETEIADVMQEMERLEKNEPPANNKRTNKVIEKGMYKEMKEIVLRGNESLFEKRNFDEEARSLSLGKYIRGMVTGKWDNAEIEKRALLTSGASSLIPAPLYSKIVDKARNTSIFSSANVPTIIMETDNLRIAKVKEDLVPAFKEEGKAAEESTPLELEALTLSSKTIYGYAYVSLEAITSAENLDAVLINSFSKAVAEGIDQAMLYGVYSGNTQQTYAPAGIFNNTDINTVTAADSNYDDILKGMGLIRSNNGTPTVLAINAATEEALSLLKDTTGRYLTPPESLTTMKRIVSNQLKNDATKGSDLLVFDPNSLVVGIQEGINIRVFDGDSECIKKGLVCFRILSMVDCVVLQPKHISRIAEFGKASA